MASVAGAESSSSLHLQGSWTGRILVPAAWAATDATTVGNMNDLNPAEKERGTLQVRAVQVGTHSIGAIAAGAIAAGALALGAVAIGCLVIGRAKIRRLEIGELIVGRLHVTDSIDTP